MIIDPSLSQYEHIKHGFFTRQNGFSHGSYQSLNMRRGSGDDPENIEKNYAYVQHKLDVSHLLTLRQIHSNHVVTISQPWQAEQRPEGDAMVTSLSNIGIGILTADCGPLLLVDPIHKVVGCAHLGRKGALLGLLENTICAMEALGAKRASIETVLGATISQKNYQVGEDVRQEINALMPHKIQFLLQDDTSEGKYFLDMPALIASLCQDAGIKFRDIGICTYAAKDQFYSYRRATHLKQSNYGCFISVIGLNI